MRPGAIALLLLAGCALPPAPASCLDGDVRLTADMPGAPASPCTRISGSEFRLDILPEAEPINPSPWYAFAIDSGIHTRTLVTLDYAAAGHRYAPWVSRDGARWTRLEPASVSIEEDGSAARLDLVLAPGRLMVAAQPPYGGDAYHALEMRWAGDWRTIGSSTQARPVRALIAPPADPEAGWILMLGRQHPPEIPGAWAFEAFADEMLRRYGAGELRAGLILVPLLNPDGVAHGHWRLTGAGVDLNRDWAARAQPEVAAVFDLLNATGIEPGDLELVVDFHATRSDRLYLPQPEELPAGPNAALEAWLGAMASAGLFERIEPVRTDPALRVSAKAVFTDLWQAPALTWEAGDETPEDEVRESARRAAALWTGSE
ncbi:hypothetical protein E5163_12510 [Marinicauda algicola]|uniref:Peptidase M14 domain-containing protein n=1 Tax=Marinicauda algicola TaxID=2029849 RepID=A0A4S2GX98_9PROT|nr:M14 family zinc carboxypeptidase [Marinicauda algicola]TGY87747.1 hypothetical protein E5163_12510 [Marinicauda algicola]